MKVAIVQRRLAHFRVPFFRRLARRVELDVLCSAARPSDEGFLAQPVLDAPFRTVMVDRLAVASRERGIWFRPGVIRHVAAGRYDAVVFEASLTLAPEIAATLAIRRALHRATLLWGSGWQPEEPALLTGIRTALHRGMIRTADGVVAYSDAAAEWFRARGARVVEIAPNATDTDGLVDFRERAARDPAAAQAVLAKYGLTTPYVVHVGTMRPAKRIDLLLDAWARVSDRRGHELVLVGGGPQQPELAQLARDRGIPAVRWLGPVYDPFEIHALFAGARCFALPGTGGLAINQACGVGTPAIVSRADGTERTLVADGVTGLVFTPGDAGSLAATIERLLADEALRARLSAAARRRIDEAIHMDAMEAGFLRAVERCVA